MERTQLLCKDACILGASTKLNLLVVLKQLVKATCIEFLLLADKVTCPWQIASMGYSSIIMHKLLGKHIILMQAHYSSAGTLF